MEKELKRLYNVMDKLRKPGGCPWDREQTHESLIKCLIEECYEFQEAVIEKDAAKMCEELGDIMLQVVFHSIIAAEKKRFKIKDVFNTVADKLIRRHPHVFGNVQVKNSDEVVTNWEKIKKGEAMSKDRTSILDGIPSAMPAMLRSLKLQKRAAKVGFDWKTPAPILSKIREEIRELEHELKQRNRQKLADELGDVLFSVVNLARRLELDPEEALQRTNRKFTERFKGMEKSVKKTGDELSDLTLKELDRYWEAEKRRKPSTRSRRRD